MPKLIQAVRLGVANFKQKQRPRSLANDQWAVHTTDSNIQNAIFEYLATTGNSSTSEGHICWRRREVPVIFVPFCVVEFLKNNRHKFPNYVSFHRKPRSAGGGYISNHGLWSAWMEGRKTPNNYLKKVFENWKRII